MKKRILPLLLAVGGTACFLVWYMTVPQLATQEHWIYRLTAGPHHQIVVAPQLTTTQTFSAPGDTLSSLVVYSDSSTLDTSALTLQLYDKNNALVAESFGVDTSYYTEKLRLHFLIHASVQRGQQYRLALINHGTAPLTLIAVENESYPNGILVQEEHEVPEQDVVLLAGVASATSGAFKLGILAGIIFLLGALLIHFIPPHRNWQRWVAASLLCVVITPLALGGLWFSHPFWGISDWDYYFSLHHIWRESIVTHHEFPFWNPYTCGGTAGLADPEFSVLTPSFLLFELPFGIPLGLRMAALFSVAVGSLGMLQLSRRLGLSVHAALLTALIAFFGSVNLLEIVEGHPNIFASMWIPWIFWSWLGAYRGQYKSFWCGLFLALTFFQGGIYLLLYTLLAFLVLPLLVSRPLHAIKTTITASLWAAGLCAVKFFPVAFWLREFPDRAYAGSQYTFSSLVDIFFGRYLHGAQVIPNQRAGWHEYGAYIGYIAFGVALIGISRFKQQRVVRGAVIAVALATLLSAIGPALEPLFDMAPWLPRSMISRVVFFAVIPLALLSGFGLDTVQKKLRFGYLVALVVVGLVAADLMSLAYPLSTQAFVIPPPLVPRAAAPAPIAYTGLVATYVLPDGVTHTRAYDATLAGYGTLNYCSVLGPQANIAIVEGEVDAFVAKINPAKASLELISWSPNHVTVKVAAREPAEVELNANYARGWRVNKEPALERNNRVAAAVPPGDHVLAFRYYTRGFLPGLFISIFTVAGTALYFWQTRKGKKFFL